MADIQEPNNVGEGKHGQARRLADAAMAAQRDGRHEDAERLLDEAQRTDPQALEEALAEARTGAKLDAAEVAGDAEVARISRTIEPGAGGPARGGRNPGGAGRARGRGGGRGGGGALQPPEGAGGGGAGAGRNNGARLRRRRLNAASAVTWLHHRTIRCHTHDAVTHGRRRTGVR